MRKQRGVTMIGWIFLLAPVAVVLYAGIRVGPGVHELLQGGHGDEGNRLAAQERRDADSAEHSRRLERRFDTGYIDEPTIKEIGIAKGEAGWQMTADYEKAVPMFGNLHLLMVFNKTVVIN